MLAVLLSVMHEAANMASIQDQLAAQIDCADVCSMLGAGRKRHLLLSEVVRVLGLRGAGGNSEMLRRACDALGSHLIAAAEEISFTQVRSPTSSSGRSCTARSCPAVGSYTFILGNSLLLHYLLSMTSTGRCNALCTAMSISH